MCIGMGPAVRLAAGWLHADSSDATGLAAGGDGVTLPKLFWKGVLRTPGVNDAGAAGAAGAE